MSAADPAIVLGDLLGQQELALELLSGGEEALRRPIAGAHAVELESPTRFLAKDWIMLSAGPRLRGHRQAQRELVVELDEAGATALGFGIEPVFDQVPRTLLAEARARSFPVFAVPPKTPFRDVVSAVNRCLLSDELVNYQRLTSMQRYLMDALTEDEPERAVISRLAKLVDARVLVFDPGGRLQISTAPAPADQLWEQVEPEQEVVQEFDAGGWHTVAMPIVTNAGQRPPWLVVTSRRSGFVNQLTRPAAQATVPLLAAITRLGGVARDQERAIRSSLLEDIVKGRAVTPAEARSLAARAATFGLTFARPARIVLARERTQRRDGDGSAVDAGSPAEALERALLDSGAPHLLASRGPGTIALVQCEDAELHAALAPLADDERPIQVGVGRPVDHLTEAHHSLRDAELAIERLGYEPGRRLLAFEDFDLGTLLVSEAPMERIDPKVEDLLAPLSEHPLLRDAIVAYFEHEMDITRTAQALCLHPNTLRYRLGRLEQLLGVSLKQPAAITALYIALMAGERSRG
jgi:PucR family transcriptional regulator, purine catabolism regulatory protein